MTKPKPGNWFQDGKGSYEWVDEEPEPSCRKCEKPLREALAYHNKSQLCSQCWPRPGRVRKGDE